MKQDIYRVISRSGVTRVRPEVGLAWRFTFAMTAAIIGALLAGGLMFWAGVLANVIAGPVAR